MKGLDECDLSQIEGICGIHGEYSKDFLQVVYDKTNDNDVTGCLLYQNKFPDISNLFYLSVKPEFRNTGIATKIINLFKKLSKPIIIMCIPKNSSAISFFVKHQFRALSQDDFLKYELDIVCDDDDIVMIYQK